jgi:hypothetical protein
MIEVIFQEDYTTPPGISAIIRGSGLPRGEGLHLTTIIKYINTVLGTAKKSPEGWSRDLCMEAGFIWEDTLSLVLGDRMGVRPGEIECDGILMSPDGIEFLESGDPVLEEYKLTWRSTRNKVEQEWDWLVQTMAYCYALGLNKTLFRILYLMGNYKGTGPVYREALLRYDKHGLKENWNMILRHKDEAREWAKTQEP